MRELLLELTAATGRDAKWAVADRIFQFLVLHQEVAHCHVKFAWTAHEKLLELLDPERSLLTPEQRAKVGLYMLKLSPVPCWKAQQLAAAYIAANRGDNIAEAMETGDIAEAMETD
jgi:hypothetical protein